jgi:seryl-tRNA synthetase
MHDIKLIRDNPDAFDAGLKSRSLKPLSADLVALDDRRRKVIGELQAAQERRNAASKDIGAAMGRKDMATADALKLEVASLKDKLTTGEAEQREVDEELRKALETIPNVPASDVPHGADEHGNIEYRSHGMKPAANHLGAQHFEIGEALGLMDFEAASKMSGARFVVLKGQLARLERAIGQFMLDLHTSEHGYTEVNPPLLVKAQPLYGTAQLPKFIDDLYEILTDVTLNEFKIQTEVSVHDLRIDQNKKFFKLCDSIHEILNRPAPNGQDTSWSDVLFLELRQILESNNTDYKVELNTIVELRKKAEKFISRSETGLFLIPTAEVPLTNLVRESITEEKALPLRFTALTPCFRSEAGSAGRDTRGMLRQHQFTKCELVSITTPETSKAEHERMLTCAENVLKKLGIHYRVMLLCTGDMGFGSQKTYDIEAWLPGQGTYREISSCSVCGDFQARRMEARYRPLEGKSPRFVHTLNGSGLAVGRTLIAVLENYLNPDGSVTVPDVLLPYMGGITRIETVRT